MGHGERQPFGKLRTGWQIAAGSRQTTGILLWERLSAAIRTADGRWSDQANVIGERHRAQGKKRIRQPRLTASFVS